MIFESTKFVYVHTSKQYKILFEKKKLHAAVKRFAMLGYNSRQIAGYVKAFQVIYRVR